jgi:hypothetical protein
VHSRRKPTTIATTAVGSPRIERHRKQKMMMRHVAKTSFTVLAVAFVMTVMTTQTADAFAPPQPTIVTTKTNSQLMMQQQNQDQTMVHTTKKAALSFLAASVVAFSTSVVPAPSDYGVNALPLPVTVGTVQPANAAEKTAKAPKLPKEEQERVDAKKNYELSQQTVKAYEKILADAKKADSTAAKTLESTTKSVEYAKKEFVTASDKLSMAKSQKMPSAAIQELTAKTSTYCIGYRKIRLCFVDEPVSSRVVCVCVCVTFDIAAFFSRRRKST